MRPLLIAVAAAASTIAFTQIASAADMPTKAPAYAPPPSTPVYSWTGFYVGGNVGYGWGSRTVNFTPNDLNVFASSCGGSFGSTCPPPASFDINGALGGLQAGYNWPFNQNWLAGIETDFNWSRIKGTGTDSFLILPGLPTGGPSNFVASQNVEWFGTVRGRLGLLPTTNLLVYGTAGFAYGRVGQNVALNSQPLINGTLAGFSFVCFSGPNCFLGSSSRIATGWTAGTGFEYAVSNNISVKGEYLYTSLGGDTINVVAVTPIPPSSPSSFTAAFNRTSFNVVRVGLDYKFGQ
jgi:outer membrane immunogenic protein